MTSASGSGRRCFRPAVIRMKYQQGMTLKEIGEVGEDGHTDFPGSTKIHKSSPKIQPDSEQEKSGKA